MYCLPELIYTHLQQDQITRETPCPLSQLRKLTKAPPFNAFKKAILHSLETNEYSVHLEGGGRRHLEFYMLTDMGWQRVQPFSSDETFFHDCLEKATKEDLDHYAVYMAKKSLRRDAGFNKVRTQMAIILLAAFSSPEEPLSVAQVADLYTRIGFTPPSNMSNLKDYLFTYISMLDELAFVMETTDGPPVHLLSNRVICGYRFNRRFYTAGEVDRACQILEEGLADQWVNRDPLVRYLNGLPEVQEALERGADEELYGLVVEKKTPFFYAEPLLAEGEVAVLRDAVAGMRALPERVRDDLLRRLGLCGSWLDEGARLVARRHELAQERFLAVMRVLRKAIVDRTALRLSYGRWTWQRTLRPDRELVVHPLRLVADGGRVVLLAVSVDRLEAMSLDVERLLMAEPVATEPTASEQDVEEAPSAAGPYYELFEKKAPAGQMLDANDPSVSAFNGGQTVVIEYWNEGFTGNLITRFGGAVTITNDGRVPWVYRAKVTTTADRAIRFCLEHCQACRLHEPVVLRDRVRDLLQNALEFNYEAGWG